ncbi:hypothetical protein ACIGXF_36785 [Streptomyces sp. NPDC053086]|uniref:hypothetical protein n=1 Tax=unclassified Streptomyces TaxID=2593676 RepID=UPI0037CEF441
MGTVDPPRTLQRTLRRAAARGIDVLVAWLPVREDDVTVGPVLFTDPRMPAVALVHELGARTSVFVEMLADVQHTNSPQVPDYWADSFGPAPPAGRTIERGPMVTAPDEIYTIVSAGEVVKVNPSHITHPLLGLPGHPLAALQRK